MLLLLTKTEMFGSCSQVFDGNLYFRPRGNRNPLFYQFDDGGNLANANRLSAFVGSGHQAATRWYYPPGWEASGIEGDPLLDAGYRPDRRGPAASGAVDLYGRGWPGLSTETFRGALAPTPDSNNQPPVVDAGLPQAIDEGVARLSGSARDDGLPNPPGVLRTTWSLASGPASVRFANAAAVTTEAYFSMPGTYDLRLAADDGAIRVDDLVRVTVIGPAWNRPPTVNAGADATISSRQLRLSATVRDDGLPSSSRGVTTRWGFVSVPIGGSVTFANASAVDTVAAFSTPGAYVLRLLADDGALQSIDQVTITVR